MNPLERNAIEELMQVHSHERDAHISNDVDALMLNQADEFTAIGDGAIHHLTGEQMRQNFVRAFSDATYHEFDDLDEPEVHVSADGNLAWMAVRIGVRKTQTDESGATRERSFISTALQTYVKRDGRWLRTGTSGNIVESKTRGASE